MATMAEYATNSVDGELVRIEPKAVSNNDVGHLRCGDNVCLFCARCVVCETRPCNPDFNASHSGTHYVARINGQGWSVEGWKDAIVARDNSGLIGTLKISHFEECLLGKNRAIEQFVSNVAVRKHFGSDSRILLMDSLASCIKRIPVGDLSKRLIEKALENKVGTLKSKLDAFLLSALIKQADSFQLRRIKMMAEWSYDAYTREVLDSAVGTLDPTE